MQDIALLKAVNAKMNYLQQNQRVISQNIANADTPDYQPSALQEVDFGRMLDAVNFDRGEKIRMSATRPGHLDGKGNAYDPTVNEVSKTYEVAPAGNAVVLEEQLMAADETKMNYTLMANIYQKQISMFKTALGKGQ